MRYSEHQQQSNCSFHGSCSICVDSISSFQIFSLKNKSLCTDANRLQLVLNLKGEIMKTLALGFSEVVDNFSHAESRKMN